MKKIIDYLYTHCTQMVESMIQYCHEKDIEYQRLAAEEETYQTNKEHRKFLKEIEQFSASDEFVRQRIFKAEKLKKAMSDSMQGIRDTHEKHVYSTLAKVFPIPDDCMELVKSFNDSNDSRMKFMSRADISRLVDKEVYGELLGDDYFSPNHQPVDD